jgi:GNAT superfamily N-acetyltransferase
MPKKPSGVPPRPKRPHSSAGVLQRVTARPRATSVAGAPPPLRWSNSQSVQKKVTGAGTPPPPIRWPQPASLQMKTLGTPPPVRWARPESLQMKRVAEKPMPWSLAQPPARPIPPNPIQSPPVRRQERPTTIQRVRQSLITEHFPIIRKVGGDFYAYLTVNGIQTEVAHIELDDYDDNGRTWLMYVTTEQGYRRRGYATMLMRAAVAEYGAIYVSQAGQQDHENRDDNDTRWLTDDGAALVNSCVVKGILQQAWLVNPFWDEEEDFSD